MAKQATQEEIQPSLEGLLSVALEAQKAVLEIPSSSREDSYEHGIINRSVDVGYSFKLSGIGICYKVDLPGLREMNIIERFSQEQYRKAAQQAVDNLDEHKRGIEIKLGFIGAQMEILSDPKSAYEQVFDALEQLSSLKVGMKYSLNPAEVYLMLTHVREDLDRLYDLSVNVGNVRAMLIVMLERAQSLAEVKTYSGQFDNRLAAALFVAGAIVRDGYQDKA